MFFLSFPSKYIGVLSGVMFTMAGVIAFLIYGIVKLTEEVTQAWRVSFSKDEALADDNNGRIFFSQAWIIVLTLVILMACHLIQIWGQYFRELRQKMFKSQNMVTKFPSCILFFSHLNTGLNTGSQFRTPSR